MLNNVFKVSGVLQSSFFSICHVSGVNCMKYLIRHYLIHMKVLGF